MRLIMREGKRERDIIKGDRDLEVKLKRKDENLIKIYYLEKFYFKFNFKIQNVKKNWDKTKKCNIWFN